MAVKHTSVTAGTTATNLLGGLTDDYGFDDVAKSMVLTNEGTVAIYIGGPGVTSTAYGYKLPADGQISFDLTRNDILFAVTASGTAVCRVLLLGV